MVNISAEFKWKNPNMKITYQFSMNGGFFNVACHPGNKGIPILKVGVHVGIVVYGE